MQQFPNALTIAGSDSGGGAGIQADLKTFAALQVYGTSVVTAVTAQNTCGVAAIHDIPVDVIVAQMQAIFEDIALDTVKIGMLGRPEVITAIADILRPRIQQGQLRSIVLDPVMVATSGDVLMGDEAVDVLRSELLPLATVITPNLPEAAVLLGIDSVRDKKHMLDVAGQIMDLGVPHVLLKGGHLANSDSIDLMYCGEELWLPAERITTDNTHGTGCTLSSALAAYLARGYAIREAVIAAKKYIHSAIEAADDLSVGQGHGPVHHFYEWW